MSWSAWATAGVMALGLAVGAAKGQSLEETAKMEAAAEKLFDGSLVSGTTPAMQSYFKRHQPMDWGGSNSGNLSEFNTPELAARRAAEIRAAGYTSAMINGLHFQLNHVARRDQIMKFTRIVADACHAEGLKVLMHFDFTIFYQPAYPLLFEHPDWALQDLRDGSHTRWCCINNPNYREFYGGYVEALAQAGVDGFQLDETSFHDQLPVYCGCEYCREKFAKETGYRFPEHWDEAVVNNRSNPLWRLWQEWQKKCIVEFKAFLLGRARGNERDIVMLDYNTVIYRSSVRVYDIEHLARVCFVGTEGSDLVFPAAFNFFAQYRILSSFAREYGKPAWVHGESNTAEEAEFAAFLTALTANGTAWMKAKVFTWPHWPEARAWSEPVADVGILLVPATRDGEVLQGDLHSGETHGWCEAFGVSGIQFELIPCQRVSLSELRKYRALVLPHAVNMSLKLASLVGDYVAEGGVVIVTGVPGRNGWLGAPLGENAFFRRMGLSEIVAADTMTYINPAHYRADSTTGGADRPLTLAPGRLSGCAERITMLNSYRFNVSLDKGTRPETMATFEDNAPAVLSIPSGKGRYIYLAFLPGHVIHQPRLQQNYIWGRYLQPEVVGLMRAVAQEATGGRDRVAVEGQGLLSAAYQDGNRLWVRMLNVSGVNLPYGEKIGVRDPRYPELGPIRIRVRMPVKAAAQFISPDRADALSLPVTVEDGESVLTVPSGAFRRFAFVRLEVTQ